MYWSPWRNASCSSLVQRPEWCLSDTFDGGDFVSFCVDAAFLIEAPFLNTVFGTAISALLLFKLRDFGVCEMRYLLSEGGLALVILFLLLPSMSGEDLGIVDNIDIVQHKIEIDNW